MKEKKAKAPKGKAAKPTKAKAKPEQVTIEKIQARYDFAEHEVSELGKKLAGLTAQKTRTEEEKKVVVGQWSMKVKEIQGQISELSSKVTAGFEMRETECEVHYDWKKGEKTYVRVSDGIDIETRKITDPERQQHLSIDAPKIVKMAPVAPGQPLTSVDEALRKAEETKEESPAASETEE